MTDQPSATVDPQLFNHLEASREAGSEALLEKLIDGLREQQDYHRLFDALMLRKKFQIGAPLGRPTSLDDVPDELQGDFRSAYIEAAREVGQLFLDDGDIIQAWPYFRTIGEYGPVAEALDKIQPAADYDEQNEQLIQIALYDGAHPVRGLQMLLKSHGTCNSVTALDQQLQQLTNEQRRQAAAVMVNTIYEELRQTLLYEVQQRMPVVPPDSSIRDLIRGREWLFENGNYHIDVSHLNAVVRFSRAFDGDLPELDRAIQLTEYGQKLDAQLQYPGEPPFEDFYTAHRHYLGVVANQDVDACFEYFEKKLADEPDTEDKQLIAYVLVDLLLRCDRVERALELAEEFLMEIGDQTGFSMTELCLETNHTDILQRVSKQRGDIVAFAASLIQPAASS